MTSARSDELPLTVFQYLVAQFGNRERRRLTLSMLLECADLGESGWSKIGEKSWRTGVGRARSEPLLRARTAGTFTAGRSMKHVDPDRWVIVKIVPLASIADAQIELPLTRFHLIMKPTAEGLIEPEEIITAVATQGLTEAIVTERFAAVDRKRRQYRCVISRVDQVVFMSMCSGYVDGWTWAEVVRVASKQAEKIRRVLDEGS